MQVYSMEPKARAEQKLAGKHLQQNSIKFSTKFITACAATIQDVDLPAMREVLKEYRNRALEDPDVWLATFETEATRRGARVLSAETMANAARLVAEITRQHDVKKVIESKSMVTEEMRLNQVLGEMGAQSIETDLDEYILQVNDSESPPHIIVPVVHKDKEEIADLFAETYKKPRLTDIPEMIREACGVLRPEFLFADMGVTGDNFTIIETGSVVIATNEGNEGMCTIMPRVYVAVMGVEKVLPTFEDLATVMRLPPRSATGQVISNYFPLLTGPCAPGERDGPDHVYLVIVDGGRSGPIGGEFQEMLHCIRCGACTSHCPVYQKIGGHTYSWVYPGPMGSALTPSYVGLSDALDLPQATTLCDECNCVCLASIPLSDPLHALREKQMERELRPQAERLGLCMWGFTAKRSAFHPAGTWVAACVLHWMGGDRKPIHSLPVGKGWTDTRDVSVPAGKTFRELYREKKV